MSVVEEVKNQQGHQVELFWKIQRDIGGTTEGQPWGLRVSVHWWRSDRRCNKIWGMQQMFEWHPEGWTLWSCSNIPTVGEICKPSNMVWQKECTFINALESSLVHWLKFLLCLNWRKPGNGGVSAILSNNEYTSWITNTPLTCSQFHQGPVPCQQFCENNPGTLILNWQGNP